MRLPIYEYECPSCSNRFELRRSFTDESDALCPECECIARRVFSPVPIIFKGSGFYVTDHKSKNGSSAPVSTTESGAASSATSSSSESSSSN
ncbi:MAG: FmdB family transcriptional regulator [Dehalococcoidales bacterium]|nr:FmdB family transcriptional regulator [Dehalococcoidales bacterium]